MNKRNLCRNATVLCGLLAIIIYTQPDTGIGHWPIDKLMSASLALLSAIFSTQWAEYQKRQDAASAQPGTPAWLRRLLFSGLLLLTMTGAGAQTTWTRRYQTANQTLADIAFGAGKYVAVGTDGLIQVSTDGITWTAYPSSTNLGDVSSSAIVYATGQFVAVGQAGHVLTSADGLTWATQVSGTTKQLNGIAYGSGQFMAVGDDGTAITSTDGVTWATLTSGTSVDINDVAYNGSLFAVIGNDGLIRTSPNGIIWTARTSNTVADLHGITVGSGGGFVAVGSGKVVNSSNGVTWSSQQVVGPSVSFKAVAYNSVSGQFVAVAESINLLYTSSDGLTWTFHPSGTDAYLYGIRYLNGQFVAVGSNGTIRSSPDGINWKRLTINKDITFQGVAYGNGHYVAVGNSPISLQPTIGSVAATSTDGINYTLGTTQHFAGAEEGFNDVIYGNGQFVAVGGEAIIQTSVDGKAWTLRHSTLGASLYGVAYGAGQYVAVGSGFGGNFVRSTNGTTWTTGTTGPNTFYYGITYANGQFVAVGFNGAIATSPEGIDWTAHSSGTGNWLKSVAYGNGTYVAVGIGGTVIKSVNGNSWSMVPSFTGLNINRVTFGNGQFVAVGYDGVIGTSPDGLVWTARPSETDGNALIGITHGNGLFVAVGYGGTVVTSPDDGGQPPVNQAPTVANTIPSQVATVGQVFSYGIPANTFSDPNGDALTVSVAGLPAGLKFTAPATISGTPTAQGASTVTVTATDPGNLAVSTQFTITVNPAGGNPGAFAITGVTMVSCQAITPTKRLLSFTPQYAGLNGQPVSFQVVNEMLPTTNAGPYALNVYIDNPSITLKATQQGTAGEASFTYSWLAACNGGVPPNPPVNPPVSGSLQMIAPVYNCQSGAFTFQTQGGDGSTIEYRAIGICGWTTNPNQFVDAETRTAADAPPIDLHARQNGVEVTLTFDIRAQCPVNAQARQGAASAEPGVVLRAVSYPNPVAEAFTVEIEGAGGQSVRLWLVDGRGRTVVNRLIEVRENPHREPMSLDQHEPGLYLLRVSTAGQTKTLKVLKR